MTSKTIAFSGAEIRVGYSGAATQYVVQFSNTCRKGVI